ncbi:NADH:flavin oxidoreductase/NADH oxidase [Deinococcus sp. KNUC1210]|uniref:NADH:flavin oxidoreductase/NADH oxidase n=1 Tax=Deinococcus sp. KNUC1210 TaxID=2917691 RepID=UPI001EF06E17|nr:NADH:flavin oxidoreductase/NADH oxidase [Deinococcus sp. KNUC1210]ULH15780.1 NADH:flavin oxidoreductase/NADH oxidase [Deinococcus sp. KNUC1210]
MTQPASSTLQDPARSAALFTELRLRQLKLKNRIVVSPMCMYSSKNGFAGDFHLAHLGSFALGGAGLIFTEAAAVSPEGRITPDDLGLWNDEHIQGLGHITDFVHAQNSRIGVQLAHAGRKASTWLPWRGQGAVSDIEGGWQVVGPDTQPFSDRYATPQALDLDGIRKVVTDFQAATRRAMMAGFDTVEVHAAHGYLLHQFMSPLSNSRTDDYGGSFDNRIRLTMEVARAVRSAFPDHLPVFVRVSATDWAEGGWSLDETVELSKRLRAEGIDVMDVSSGGLTPLQKIEVGPGYQLPFAQRIRQEADMPVMGVGLITTPQQAEDVVAGDQADLVAIAREFLRDPRFPQRAARELGVKIEVPSQYGRAISV